MARGIWILIVLASLKILTALPIFALVTLRPDVDSPFPSWVYISHLTVFAAVGLVLLAGGRRDRRAQLLGAAFVLAASLFANRPLGRLLATAPLPLSEYVLALRLIEPGAFRPLLVWMFAKSFPREAVAGKWHIVGLAGIAASGLFGATLFAEALIELARHARTGALATGAIDTARAAAMGQLNTILTLGGVLFVVVKMRAAESVERRRAELFVWGLLFGTGPILLQAAAESVIHPYGSFMRQPSPRLWSGLILYPLVWSGLATAAYAVYAREVLSVRLVIRRAIQYALAKATILAFVIVPFATIIWFLYQRRGQRLGDILSSDQLLLLAMAGASLVVLRVRPRLLKGLDRRFFREQYDAKLILGALIDDTRSAHTLAALASHLSVEINRALHVDGVNLFIADEAGRSFISATETGNALSSTAAVLVLLGGDSEPMDVDLETPRHPLQRLSESERKWLRKGRYRLLVPVKSTAGHLIGVIAVGGKRSELPFSSGDRWLLSSIAGSAAVAIENIILRSSADSPPLEPAAHNGELTRARAADGARECERCYVVHERTSATRCDVCDGLLRDAPVPRVVRGFRLERRIGTGGMGVVYRAIDTNLGRIVAIKTLPGISAVDAKRLRREARAMAAVSHPNVATIFAVEVWQEQPLLVVEYFENGTLGDKLKRSSLDAAQVLTLGADVCAGLEHIHGAGMLHRDIKPSNIAFANNGAVKLLDFGLAKITGSDLHQSGMWDDSTTLGGPTPLAARITPTGILAGTPMYFSPELLNTYMPDQQSDLWALALTLFEAIAGRNPMATPSLSELLKRVRGAEVPDLREFKPECPGEVAALLASALDLSPDRRPRSAADFGRRLDEVLNQMSRLESPRRRSARETRSNDQV